MPTGFHFPKEVTGEVVGNRHVPQCSWRDRQVRAKLCERRVGRDGEWASSPFSVGPPTPAPPHSTPCCEEWRPAATGACSPGLPAPAGRGHCQCSCSHSWPPDRDPGLGHQGGAPGRLSTFPCCSELKMALWEPTSKSQGGGEEVGRGGQGGPGAFRDPEWPAGRVRGQGRERHKQGPAERQGHTEPETPRLTEVAIWGQRTQMRPPEKQEWHQETHPQEVSNSAWHSGHAINMQLMREETRTCVHTHGSQRHNRLRRR